MSRTKALLAEFRARLAAGECVLGTFAKTNDASFAEIAALGGLDFIILDTEHGIAGVTDLHHLTRAVELGGALPIVRVAALRADLIQMALDSGAAGIHVPGVENARAARQVVNHAYFAPKGARGVCRYVRAAAYSATAPGEYFAQSNDVLTIVHLEGKEAVENADAIADVDGIDIFFIGPWDLSQSLGIPGQVNHPRMLEEISRLVHLLKPRGGVLGTFLDDHRNIKAFAEAGIQYFAYGTDVGLFYQTCCNLKRSIGETFSGLNKVSH